MNFNSGAFLIFLPVVVSIYWLLPYKGRKYWLLAASYFFYMYWNPFLIILLLFSTAVDYFCGLGMEKFRENQKAKKRLLLCSICMNLGMLFFFKYWDFFGGEINKIFANLSVSCHIPIFHLLLPVGISFYTFQTMSYTIDVYRGDVAAESDFIIFALYVTFFPQLVAGPIESPKNLLPQLKKEHKPTWEDFTAGVRLILCGFFRKCVVADFCGIFVTAVFEEAKTANSLSIVIAGALFCIQMYCDFAGYSEIAAGSARLMGVRLMRNFDRPYLSVSYTEFFRRWHISLNRWFTSYVYIPLGGSRKGKARKIRNTFIVFALCGLWHGAGWTYLLWGIYAACFVCLESLLGGSFRNLVKRWKIDLTAPGMVLFRRCIMFLIFIPAALIFRAENIYQLKTIFLHLFAGSWSLKEAISITGLTSYTIIQLMVIIAVMIRIYDWELYDLPAAKTGTESARRLASAVYLCLAIALCWLALLASQDIAGFAYFQF